MQTKRKAISVTFINNQNKVFDFSNIILKDDDGDVAYSDSWVNHVLAKHFGGYENLDILKKLSICSSKSSDSWNNTNKIVNNLKHEIFLLETKLNFLKTRLNAIEDTKSYITHVNSCSNNIEWNT